MQRNLGRKMQTPPSHNRDDGSISENDCFSVAVVFFFFSPPRCQRRSRVKKTQQPSHRSTRQLRIGRTPDGLRHFPYGWVSGDGWMKKKRNMTHKGIFANKSELRKNWCIKKHTHTLTYADTQRIGTSVRADSLNQLEVMRAVTGAPARTTKEPSRTGGAFICTVLLVLKVVCVCVCLHYCKLSIFERPRELVSYFLLDANMCAIQHVDTFRHGCVCFFWFLARLHTTNNFMILPISFRGKLVTGKSTVSSTGEPICIVESLRSNSPLSGVQLHRFVSLLCDAAWLDAAPQAGEQPILLEFNVLRRNKTTHPML